MNLTHFPTHSTTLLGFWTDIPISAPLFITVNINCDDSFSGIDSTKHMMVFTQSKLLLCDGTFVGKPFLFDPMAHMDSSSGGYLII